MRFKIDWASLIVKEGNLLFLLCFTLYLRAISKYKPPRGLYIWRDNLTEGFLHCEGFIHGRSLFSELYGNSIENATQRHTPISLI